ncbi:MAG TPA: nucleotidyltransferase family protein [Steroidobacteraceae bacterium]|nr:nucleotidyltransferase family protein [Steroidobacteraceae bacterium]
MLQRRTHTAGTPYRWPLLEHVRNTPTVIPLPPMTTVARALRAITEYLAAELAVPKATPPEWCEAEWRIARAVAVMQGISGLLATSVSWHGPPGWSQFLQSQHEHITLRQTRIQALQLALADRFREECLPVQALKGAALYLEGIYQAGQRPMADLDLLVPASHARRAARILELLGLRESHRTFKHRVFEAPDAARPSIFGEHSRNGVKVELHERICEILPYRVTDISSRVFHEAPAPGLNTYPSRVALMAHLLLHTAGAMATRTLRLIQLHDINRLARQLEARDWQQFLDWHPWWAWPPLALAERYVGEATPPAVAQAVRVLCPAILRYACARQSLTDVSLSRLWVEALPGIEWARTAGEAATFVARRIVPSAENRSDRRYALATDPSLARGDWGRLSQGRRILRALRTRTPRPWPLHNVRVALAEPA